MVTVRPPKKRPSRSIVANNAQKNPTKRDLITHKRALLTPTSNDYRASSEEASIEVDSSFHRFLLSIKQQENPHSLQRAKKKMSTRPKKNVYTTRKSPRPTRPPAHARTHTHARTHAHTHTHLIFGNVVASNDMYHTILN